MDENQHDLNSWSYLHGERCPQEMREKNLHEESSLRGGSTVTSLHFIKQIVAFKYSEITMQSQTNQIPFELPWNMRRTPQTIPPIKTQFSHELHWCYFTSTLLIWNINKALYERKVLCTYVASQLSLMNFSLPVAKLKASKCFCFSTLRLQLHNSVRKEIPVSTKFHKRRCSCRNVFTPLINLIHWVTNDET